MPFQTLPVELVTMICRCDLSLSDLGALRIQTKTIYQAVEVAITQIYRAELKAAAAIERSRSSGSSFEPLARLRGRESAWSLSPLVSAVHRRSRIPAPSHVEVLNKDKIYDVNGGYFLTGVGNDESDEPSPATISYCPLFAGKNPILATSARVKAAVTSTKNDVSMWRQIPFGPTIIYGFKLALEDSNLLAVISQEDEEEETNLNMVLHLLEFPTGCLHPKAAYKTIKICRGEDIRRVSNISVCEGRIGFTLEFVQARATRFFLYDWHSGNQICTKDLTRNYGTRIEFSFLSQDVLLFPRTGFFNEEDKSARPRLGYHNDHPQYGYLEICSISRNASGREVLVPEVDLVLPALKSMPGLSTLAFGCECWPISPLESPHNANESSGSFMSDLSKSIAAFTLQFIWVNEAGIETYPVYKFVMHRQALLSLVNDFSPTTDNQDMATAARVPWEEWGPSRTSWFHSDVDIDLTSFARAIWGQRFVAMYSQKSTSEEDVDSTTSTVGGHVGSLAYDGEHMSNEVVSDEHSAGEDALLRVYNFNPATVSSNEYAVTSAKTFKAQERTPFAEDIRCLLPHTTHSLQVPNEFDTAVLYEEGIALLGRSGEQYSPVSAIGDIECLRMGYDSN